MGVGDELLPETPRGETGTEVIVNACEDAWTFVLSVDVSNDGEAGYELRPGPVTTTEGKSVRGTASTGCVRPGETVAVTGEWTPDWGGARHGDRGGAALQWRDAEDGDRGGAAGGLTQAPNRRVWN